MKLMLASSTTLVALLAGCQGTPSSADETGSNALAVQATYHGFAWIGTGPDEQPSADEPLLIRDAEAFAAFQDRIPKKEITMTNPAPPSHDPMLTLEPDFSKHMMLVAFYPETVSMYASFGDATLANGMIHAHVDRPERTPEDRMMSRPLGLGTYTAILVDAHEGDACFAACETP